MDVKKYAEAFWEDGFICIENFFHTLLMDQLNDSILEHFSRHPNWIHNSQFISKSETEVVPWFPFREGNKSFEPIENDPKLEWLTHEILGEGWESLYLMVMFSKKGTKGQAWHQDCPPEESSQFNLNRLCYTHDINDTTGGKTIVMPGSHRKGIIPSGNPHEDLDNQVVLAPKKGTLVILHGHTWHRVLPVKGAYRFSTNARAIPKGTSENITDIAVYRNMRYRFSTSEVIEER